MKNMFIFEFIKKLMNQENIKKNNEENEILENTNDEQLKDIVENKDVAASSYFLVLSPILLLTRKDSAFIQHHARQSLALLLIFIFLWILGSFYILFKWSTIGVFFIAFVSFIQTINGKYYKIPYIYDFVKDGYSISLFINLIKKSITGIKKIIIGLFPKNSLKKNTQINTEINKKYTQSEEIKNLSLKIDKLEKKINLLEEQIKNK